MKRRLVMLQFIFIGLLFALLIGLYIHYNFELKSKEAAINSHNQQIEIIKSELQSVQKSKQLEIDKLVQSQTRNLESYNLNYTEMQNTYWRYFNVIFDQLTKGGVELPLILNVNNNDHLETLNMYMQKYKQNVIENNWKNTTLEPVFQYISVEPTEETFGEKKDGASFYLIYYYRNIPYNDRSGSVFDGIKPLYIKLIRENNQWKALEYGP